MCLCVVCVCIDIEPCVASHFTGVCNSPLHEILVLCVTMLLHMHFCVYIENHVTRHISVRVGGNGKCMALVDLYIVHCPGPH